MLAYDGVIPGALVLWITRSRRAAVIVLSATIVLSVRPLAWNEWGLSLGFPGKLYWRYGWHAVMAGTLLHWAIHERIRVCRIGRCRCGYDLRGLLSEVCPECGRPVESENRGSGASTLKAG